MKQFIKYLIVFIFTLQTPFVYSNEPVEGQQAYIGPWVYRVLKLGVSVGTLLMKYCAEEHN